MTDQSRLQLTDALIEQMLAQRAGPGAPADLVPAIAAAIESTGQRAPGVLGTLRGPAGSRTRRGPGRTWLLAAGALLLVGGAMAAGSGLVKLPSVVPPVPAPTAPVAVASPTAGPTMSPSPTETSSAVQPRAASWTPTGDMVAGRWGGTAVLLQDGKVLLVGGNSAPWPPDAEVYDPATRTWTATGPLITPRMSFTATRLLDGRVLVVGGQADNGALASPELYDPTTGSWTATGKLHTPHYFGATATLLPDGRVLVAGGVSSGDGVFTPVASAELYDPGSGSWTRTGSMGTKREGASATLLLDGRVLVAGGSAPTGNNAGEPVSSAELYDPGTGTWTPTGGMIHAAGGSGATLLDDGSVLVVGFNELTASVELYDPATGSWTATTTPLPLRGKEVGFSVTSFHDGRVLVAGGVLNPLPCDDPASASAQLYDPRTAAWTATSDMIQGRAGHTAILLPDGKVLVVGGTTSWMGEPCRPGVDGPTPRVLSSAELYDPGTGQ
jgi:N-acetylneuraminic acid mutarotase